MPDHEPLVRTLRTLYPDGPLHEWMDNSRDLLFVDLVVAGRERRLSFGDVSQHSLGGLDDEQRSAVLRTLLADAASWPEDAADVRCVRDVANLGDMRGETDICVFVKDEPVSTVVRIITAMTRGAREIA